MNFSKVMACAAFALVTLSGISVNSYGQCVANPTYTVSGNNNGNYNLNAGQTMVIAANASFSGSLNMNGGTLCIQGTVQSSASINANGGSIYNYGNFNQSNFNTPSGLAFYNYAYVNISGNLNINSGGTWFEDGLTTVGGNLHINATVTGSPNVCGGFRVAGQSTLNSNGSVSQVDVCDSGHPTGGFDVRNGAVDASVTWCSCTFSGPLPVELVAYDVVYDGKEVMVTWSTASEQNNDYFLVEKSSDGANWVTLARVNGAGNSNILTNYGLQDTPSGGTWYYRLSQVDYDGTTTIFEVKSITCSAAGEAEINVYPNPVTDGQTNLQLINWNSGTATWSLLTMAGTEIATGKIAAHNTTITQSIPLTGMAPGVYLLRVSDAGQDTRYERVVVR